MFKKKVGCSCCRSAAAAGRQVGLQMDLSGGGFGRADAQQRHISQIGKRGKETRESLKKETKQNAQCTALDRNFRLSSSPSDRRALGPNPNATAARRDFCVCGGDVRPFCRVLSRPCTSPLGHFSVGFWQCTKAQGRARLLSMLDGRRSAVSSKGAPKPPKPHAVFFLDKKDSEKEKKKQSAWASVFSPASNNNNGTSEKGGKKT